jgi:hypothetical protein
LGLYLGKIPPPPRGEENSSNLGEQDTYKKKWKRKREKCLKNGRNGKEKGTNGKENVK